MHTAYAHYNIKGIEIILMEVVHGRDLEDKQVFVRQTRQTKTFKAEKDTPDGRDNMGKVWKNEIT